MLDSELNTHPSDSNEAAGRAAGPAPVPIAVFQAPQVVFQPPPSPTVTPASGGRDNGSGRDIDDPGGAEAETSAPRAARRTRASSRVPDDVADDPAASGDSARPARKTRGGRTRTTRAKDTAAEDTLFGLDSTEAPGALAEAGEADRGNDRGNDRGSSGRGSVTEADTADVADADDRPVAPEAGEDADEGTGGSRRRRTTRSRSRSRSRGDAAYDDSEGQPGADGGTADGPDADADSDLDGERADDGDEGGASGRRRRRKRRRGSVEVDVLAPDDPPDTVVHVREAHSSMDDVRSIKGSTRLEAKKQRRREGRESGRRRPPVITESEFLARRESVERSMIVRQRGERTQIAVLEDEVLVEHYVNKTSQQSYVGNVYLGKVQNVLPSMEAAFVDIGKGRNAVLYAGEVNFDASGMEGQPKRIESALKPGQAVIVQVTKDPVGHKGARLTSMISLPGRYLVYVPGASMTGISRKLPDTERNRLKHILKKVTPENAGVIVRTAAEGAAEEELDRDITRLAAQWEAIEKKAKTASAPALLHGEPDLTVRVIRDVFNEDFGQLIVSGDDSWEIIDEYLKFVAPQLAERVSRWEDYAEAGSWDGDVFAAYRIDEQLAKALDRKVWLPSGGSLVIDRTEAMTVVDVNTGKFTGQGGNLEETVTRNNLEAAEEIVRQLRLRDVGGIVVIDFIDMVLESNRDLVLRRLLECLARDRTKHQVAEVTSLGLVQMTRKRVGAGLIEAFSQQCECCNGRGVIVALDSPPEGEHRSSAGSIRRPIPVPPPGGNGGNGRSQSGNGGGGNGGGGNGGGGNGRGRGSGSGGGQGGHANGYESTSPGNPARNGSQHVSADELTPAIQDAPATLVTAALVTADAPVAGGTPVGGAPVGGAPAGGAPAGGTPVGGTPAGETAPRGRRTRRGTAGGTAFAAVVISVDDAAPAAAAEPATTTAPEARPALDNANSAVTPGDSGANVVPAQVAAPPARRRTRAAGSAVARVAAEPAEPAEPVTPPDQVIDGETVTQPEVILPAEIVTPPGLETPTEPDAS